MGHFSVLENHNFIILAVPWNDVRDQAHSNNIVQGSTICCDGLKNTLTLAIGWHHTT